MRLALILSAIAVALSCSLTPKNREVAQSAPPSVQDENNFNVYETQWETFKDMPIYNQSGLPACYSYAASQLTEFYLRKSNQLISSNEHVSPLWGAFLFKDKSGHLTTPMKWAKKTVGYGFSRVAINQLRKFGICKSSTIDENVKNVIPAFPLGEGDVIGLIDLVWANKDLVSAEKIVEQIKNHRNYLKVLRNYLSYYDVKTQYKSDSELDYQVLTPAVGKVLSFIEDSLVRYNTKNYYDFFEKAILTNCDQSQNVVNYDLSKVNVSIQMYASDKKVERKLIEAFKKTNFEYPVAIAYCSNVYKPEDEHLRIKPRLFILPRIVDRSMNSGENCSGHYSLAVGRRFNSKTQSHDILVRNSYGNTFMPESQGCFCRNNNTNRFESCQLSKENPIFPPKPLTVLGCWINQEKLIKTMYDINYYSIN